MPSSDPSFLALSTERSDPPALFSKEIEPELELPLLITPYQQCTTVLDQILGDSVALPNSPALSLPSVELPESILTMKTAEFPATPFTRELPNELEPMLFDGLLWSKRLFPATAWSQPPPARQLPLCGADPWGQSTTAARFVTSLNAGQRKFLEETLLARDLANIGDCALPGALSGLPNPTQNGLLHPKSAKVPIFPPFDRSTRAELADLLPQPKPIHFLELLVARPEWSAGGYIASALFAGSPL